MSMTVKTTKSKCETILYWYHPIKMKKTNANTQGRYLHYSKEDKQKTNGKQKKIQKTPMLLKQAIKEDWHYYI